MPSGQSEQQPQAQNNNTVDMNGFEPPRPGGVIVPNAEPIMPSAVGAAMQQDGITASPTADEDTPSSSLPSQAAVRAIIEQATQHTLQAEQAEQSEASGKKLDDTTPLVAPLEIQKPDPIFATAGQQSLVDTSGDVSSTKGNRPNRVVRSLVSAAVILVLVALSAGAFYFVRTKSAKNVPGNPSSVDSSVTSQTPQSNVPASTPPSTPAVNQPVSNPAPKIAGDTERKNDIDALFKQLDTYYVSKGKYPTLTEMNTPTFRSQYLPSLTLDQLKDPAGTAAQLVGAPTKNAYAYAVTNDQGQQCDNKLVECQFFTLTAVFSTGESYVRRAVE